jgi:hypothetical protein
LGFGPKGGAPLNRNLKNVIAESGKPSGLDPFEKLRRLAARQLDELAAERENLSEKMTIADHERAAKALIAMTKLVQELFEQNPAAPDRKTGEELKREDDAIRAEFARRLAAVLRGKQIAAGAGGDEPRPPAPDPQ